MLLHVLVAAERATDLDVRIREPQNRGPEIERGLAFAERMRNPDPAMRPPARTVESIVSVLTATVAVGASISSRSRSTRFPPAQRSA